MSNNSEYEAPHCNVEVLHAPGECEFCDKFPGRQQLRIASETPFSPVEQAWLGNRPEGYRDLQAWLPYDDRETVLERVLRFLRRG